MKQIILLKRQIILTNIIILLAEESMNGPKVDINSLQQAKPQKSGYNSDEDVTFINLSISNAEEVCINISFQKLK